MEQLIQKIVSVHSLHSPYTESRIKNLDTTPILHINYDYDDAVIVENQEDKCVIWSHFASLLAPLVKPMLVFLCSIPSFVSTTWNEKLLCLKLHLFEIWMLQSARLADCYNGTVTFCNGYYMSREQLEKMYDTEFVNRLFEFIGFIHDLQLSDNIIALYSALVLYSNDLPFELCNMGEQYKIYLSYQLHKNKKPDMYQVLLSILPELHEIGKRHLHFEKRMSRYIVPHTDQLLLLADTFDLIKEEDIKKLAYAEN